MKRQFFLAFAVGLFCVCALPTSTVLAQGSLSQVRDSVRGDSGGSSDDHDDDDHSTRKKSRDHCNNGGNHETHFHFTSDGEGFDDLAFEILAYMLTSPFWGPHVAVDSGFDVPGQFETHPYDRSEGLMMIGWPSTTSHIAQFNVEYATDFDDLQRVGGKLLWEHSTRFGVDTSVNYFQEAVQGLPDDSLWLGDANVVFRFAQSERLVMRTGLGVNWISDDGSDAGFNFTYGADWFPDDPVIVSAEIDWGTLGDASLFHGRVTVGAVFEHVELFTGFDYYDIDGTPLRGMVAGLRVWF